MTPIVIVDYGMGNLRSVQKGFEKVGHAALISADPNVVASADKVVLPGVGAFCDAIARINEAGLAAPLREHIHRGKKFLGICLGLQLLFTTSHEEGLFTGLDLFAGEVVRFPETPGLKVPHMGWNGLRVVRRAPIFQETTEGSAVYFVHSYYVVPRDANLAATLTDYPTPFVSSIWADNVVATQFHPEKSQGVGLEMLRQFGRWA